MHGSFGPGEDAFHRVPSIPGEVTDAVERVLTGFSGAKHIKLSGHPPPEPRFARQLPTILPLPFRRGESRGEWKRDAPAAHCFGIQPHTSIAVHPAAGVEHGASREVGEGLSARGLSEFTARTARWTGPRRRLSAGAPVRSQRNVRKHLPRADTGARFLTNERTAKAIRREPRNVPSPTG